jgi:hypothetical protein
MWRMVDQRRSIEATLRNLAKSYKEDVKPAATVMRRL